MMKLEKCLIVNNEKIALNTYQMKLLCDSSWIKRSGQFVNVAVDSKKLRRPLSITCYDEKHIVLTYKVIGEGTKLLSMKKSGEIEILNGLGNGFDLDVFESEVLVIGGGIGCAPLMGTIKEALQRGLNVKVIFGFKNKQEALFQKELEQLGVEYRYSFDDQNENAVDKMIEMKWDHLPFCTCGPVAMMKSVCEHNSSYGLASLETRMGCGFGACMGCAVEMKSGMKRICKEGPVFNKEEILWENLR